MHRCSRYVASVSCECFKIRYKFFDVVNINFRCCRCQVLMLQTHVDCCACRVSMLQTCDVGFCVEEERKAPDVGCCTRNTGRNMVAT
jgi:hypothetical protein